MIGLVLARALTAPPTPRRFPLKVLSGAHQSGKHPSVILERTTQTAQAGTWGLFLDDGRHLRLTGTPTRGSVQSIWPLDDGVEPPQPGSHAAWSGIADRTPGDLGLVCSDELILTPGGVMPAWRIRPGGGRGDGDVWAVHIHGMGSTRAGVLRGAAVTARAGVPGLAVTYRNTTEGPRFGNGRSSLGAVEADDVAAQLQYLETLGAKRFVLFGWSMGAQIALRLAADPRWRAKVSGLVLDSPVLDWEAVIAANLRHRRVPHRVAGSARRWLRSPALSKLVGVDRPVDLDELDWLRRAGEVSQPVLVLHGTKDWSAPIESSRAFAATGAATLMEFEAGHTLNWNVDAQRWERGVRSFVSAVA